jgi:UDP-N-acetylglucosamine 2-epimerase (non-hydrolysing)
LKKPKYNLNIKFKTPIEFIGKSLILVEKILLEENPDAILILGDTNSALSALCAKRKKTPIFHIEAGNRCFDQRVPEEINRKIVDHVSDINMTYSDYASTNLLSEGILKDRIVKIGSPLKEVYKRYEDNINKSNILVKKNLKEKGFILASIHREENVEDYGKLKIILESLVALKKKLKIPVIFSTHPRTRNMIKLIKKSFNNKIDFNDPFGFFDYAKLLKNAKLVFSDSGSITEESFILSIPSINLRNANERQEGMQLGISVMSSVNLNDITNSAQIALKKNNNFNLNSFPDYSRSNVSDAVVVVIQSHIDYINKKIWFKK